MTLNNKLLQLPSEQLSWLALIKNLFKREFNKKSNRELISAIRNKAIEKDYKEIGWHLNSYDLETYFKN